MNSPERKRAETVDSGFVGEKFNVSVLPSEILPELLYLSYFLFLNKLFVY